jgi:hypothetical protein
LYTEERTYRDLVGPLGRKRAVCAECLFVDPVADIALLGPPDSQDLGEQHEAYERRIDAIESFAISAPPRRRPE